MNVWSIAILASPKTIEWTVRPTDFENQRAISINDIVDGTTCMGQDFPWRTTFRWQLTIQTWVFKYPLERFCSPCQLQHGIIKLKAPWLWHLSGRSPQTHATELDHHFTKFINQHPDHYIIKYFLGRLKNQNSHASIGGPKTVLHIQGFRSLQLRTFWSGKHHLSFGGPLVLG